MEKQQVKRWDIINSLIKRNDYKKYLEIGLQSGLCFEQVKCNYKISIDPDETANNPTHRVTSDEYFDNICNEKFDIIFIDGLHHAEQVYKDINNALSVLNEGGTIVCHDMLPTSEIIAQVPRINTIWTGDCFKAWIKLRAERKDLLMRVVDTDWGCGVISKGSQELIQLPFENDLDNITYEYFSENKKIMNIIEFSEL